MLGIAMFLETFLGGTSHITSRITTFVWLFTSVNDKVFIELGGVHKGLFTLVAGMLEGPMMMPVMFSLTLRCSKFHLTSRVSTLVWLVTCVNNRMPFELEGVPKDFFALVAGILHGPMMVPEMYLLAVQSSKFHLTFRVRTLVWLVTGVSNNGVPFELEGVWKSLFTLVASMLEGPMLAPVMSLPTLRCSICHLTSRMRALVWLITSMND